ncbi:MAG: hypothetical protein JNK74_12085 [Candidatus Hydrogenedentes bacterium]|nr:hypothetical protein [Candidatus Hydrogenedentota bacterium]
MRYQLECSNCRSNFNYHLISDKRPPPYFMKARDNMNPANDEAPELDSPAKNAAYNPDEYKVWPGAIWPRALILAVVGFTYSCVLGLMGAGLTGAGHGWGGGAGASILPLIQVPLLGVAWAYRQSRIGFYLSIILLISAAANDLLLLLLGLPSPDIFERVGGILALWGILFVSWQLVAVLVWYVGFKSLPE